MAAKKPRKKAKKVLNQSQKKGPIPSPKKPLTMRQKFMNWLTGDVSG